LDIPVYPATGNHDTWPVNVMDFTSPNVNYQINHIVGDWAEWLGEEAAAEFA
jgi:sphingomyelin phosphodiesterase